VTADLTATVATSAGGLALFGTELVLDLDGCDPDVIADGQVLAVFAAELCDLIGMRAYGPPIVERFGFGAVKTAGFTLVQLLETSSVVAHFSEAWRSAHVNVFSCRPFDTGRAAEFTAGFFGASAVRARVLERQATVGAVRP